MNYRACLSAMLLLVCSACNQDGTGPEASKQLSLYLPLQNFRGAVLLSYERHTMAKYPQYYWHLTVPSSNLVALERTGFRRQDRAELEFVQKILAEDIAHAFKPSASDRLYGKETDKADVKVIVQEENQWFVWVFRH